jgi:hypothetical protein
MAPTSSHSLSRLPTCVPTQQPPASKSKSEGLRVRADDAPSHSCDVMAQFTLLRRHHGSVGLVLGRSLVALPRPRRHWGRSRVDGVDDLVDASDFWQRVRQRVYP